MSVPIMFFGIFLFAVVTAVLVVWGMRKAYFQRENLMKMLLSKSSEKVLKYLDSHKSVTKAQIIKLTEGIEASEFLSKSKAVVQKDAAFADTLIKTMLKEGLIEPEGKGAVYKKTNKK